MDEFLIYGEPIKGWCLVRSMKDVPDAKMKAGEWAIAFSEFFFTKKNFLPSFFFKDIPTQEFSHESGEDEVNKYLKNIDDFERRMKVDPQVGYAFYNSCLNDGFDSFSDDFHIFVADRIAQCARDGQKKLSKQQLNILMNIFVAKEQYEKAALVRDTLDNKDVTQIF